MTENWHESLFSSDKGDSLGDGTWGRSSDADSALPPVAWDKIPDAAEPKKKVRARLATPAPGSQKESGLLDIRALAAGMRLDESTALPKRPAPAEAPAAPARLATQAKASTGSGLIDVGELARLQQEEAAKAAAKDDAAQPALVSSSGSASALTADASVSSSSASLTNLPSTSSSALLASSSLTAPASSAAASQVAATNMAEVSSASLVAPATGQRSFAVAIVAVLALAVAGLAAFVLSGS